MIGFKTTLLKFDSQGEKTGWTYILIPAKIARQLKPGNNKSFRVKGKIDEYELKSVALMPVGDGNFILAVNAIIRRAIQKVSGAPVKLALMEDSSELKLSADLLICLNDEPEANEYFKSLAASHQQYFSKWIESAKTDVTKMKRLALAMEAFNKKLSYGEMIRINRHRS